MSTDPTEGEKRSLFFFFFFWSGARRAHQKEGGGGRIDENRREKCGLVKSKVFSKKRYIAPVEGRGEKVH